MQAGWLRHRITVQKRTATRSASGAVVESWSTHVTAWASVEPLRGQEYLAAKAQDAAVDIRIRMRYQAGITQTMRVLYGSRVFEIVSVIHILEKKRELQLMCREVV